ncbi:ROK family protein [Ruminococcaceae bacterium OttesenSCG-928-L11]|nr:ROK family protein [Ruminococcaceae bacterium OttesenSCG-928-L11]
MSQYTIGIDVGGTKIAYGLFDADKKLMATRRQRSNPDLEPAPFFDGIAAEIQDLCGEHGIAADALRGVGIGMPSFILFEEGYIVKTVNLTRLKDFPARAYLAEKLGGNVRVMLDNDAHTAALAEHRHGAGRGFSHMLYCPVSTGVSSGIVIDNRLFHGSYGWSGESGHMLLTPGEGVECGCGNRGCIMSWCSGSMIVKHIQNWIADGAETLMTKLAGSPEAITTLHISEAFAKGDGMAIRAVEQMTDTMAVWLYNLYVILNINCYVFGGGLLNMDVPLLEQTREKFDRYNRDERPVYFKTAELGEDFGIIGAAELVD